MSTSYVEVIVDRIEGKYAVLEVQGDLLEAQGTHELEHVDFPLTALPPGTKEGSVLEIRLRK